MHGDFKYNLMRINLLKLGEEKDIKIENLESFFKNKGISNVSKEEIKAQLEHLVMEKFLIEKTKGNYGITDQGRKEIEEVKAAIEKF